MIINSFIKLKPIGASLSIAGISLGMYLDFFLKGVTHWTVLFMALSVLLLVEWKNVFKFRFPSLNTILRCIVLFQLFMVFYGVISGNMSSQLLSYHLYVIMICYAYGSIDKFDDFNSLPVYLYWVSLPGLIMAVVLCYSGFYEIEAHREMEAAAGGKDEMIIDSLTMTYGAIYPVFALLCFEKKGRVMKVMTWLTIILSSYVLLESGKRTAPFLLILGIYLYFYLKRIKLKRIIYDPKFIFYAFAVMVILVFIYVSDDLIQEKADKIFDSFVEGVKGLAGVKKADYGTSVEQRLYIRKMVDQYVNNDFTIMNYILGGGYYVMDQIDNPIYQSYIDMGIIGFCLFTFFNILFPISIIIKRPRSSIIILPILLSLQPLVTFYSSGTPYHHVKYVSICLLAFTYYSYKKSLRMRQDIN